MLIIGLSIVFTLIGVILIYKGFSTYESECAAITGIILTMISGAALIVSLTCMCCKPKLYKDFKIEYDTIKEATTYKDDIRDAAYTQNIIIINKQIRSCREYKDSIWVGIFQVEGICNAELLEKGDKNE